MKLFGKWNKEPAPVRKEEFLFAEEAKTTSGANQHDQSVGQNRKILVVDDNPVVLKAFELKMQALGFQVLTATEGSAAVSRARHEKPELIVLDINFPPEVGSSGLQWDGFNIMQWLQRFQEVAAIPVIIITSSDPEKLKEKAFAAGAVAFFQKPINHEEFLMAVRRTLGQAGAKPKPV